MVSRFAVALRRPGLVGTRCYLVATSDGDEAIRLAQEHTRAETGEDTWRILFATNGRQVGMMEGMSSVINLEGQPDE